MCPEKENEEKTPEIQVDSALTDKIKEMVKDKLLSQVSKGEKGMQLYEEGNIEEAIQEWEKVVKDDPEDGDTWQYLALAYHEKKDLENAISAYKKAQELDPDDPDILKNLGKALYDGGNVESAINQWKSALKIDGDDAESWYYLAIGFEDTGNAKGAIEAYKILKKLEPEKHEILVNLGTLYLNGENQNLEEAKDCFTKAIELEPDDPTSYYNLACAHALAGEADDATKLLSKVIEMAPDWKEDIKEDDDFNGIRDEVKFKKLLE
ncbi:MAG: tetratricopeptide repeat protein [Candidatus Hodarchaeota archaeon]